MSTALIILGIFVIEAMIVENVVENRAHKSPKAPMEDLRLAYAPDLIQVFRDQDLYQEKQELEAQMQKVRNRQASKDAEKERWELYERQLVDARIKRWIEGNPVTDENPLTEKEQPISPYKGYYY